LAVCFLVTKILLFVEIPAIWA